MSKLLRDFLQSVRNFGEPPCLSDYDFLRPRRCEPPAGSPRVSIVTCVYNGGNTLERAIDSVRRQTWSPIEYVVVDGGSTDETSRIIERNDDLVHVLLSEPDDGLYDAFNRGVAVATGEYIAVLNADDALEPDHIARSLAAIETQEADFSFGDVEMVAQTPAGPRVHYRPADRRYADVLQVGTTELHHATMLVHRRVFETIGLFRTGLRIAADYDWFIRMHKAGFRGAYSGVISRMSFGGVSTDRQELSILEAAMVAWRNGGPKGKIVRFWGGMLLRRIFGNMKSLLKR